MSEVSLANVLSHTVGSLSLCYFFYPCRSFCSDEVPFVYSFPTEEPASTQPVHTCTTEYKMWWME